MSAWLLYDEGEASGAELRASAGEWVLSAWPDTQHRPHPQARRCDPRLLEASGAVAWVSLLWPDRDRLPLFDDPAVVQARRCALAGRRPRSVSTLTVDSQHWAGSLWAADSARGASDDPFRLLGLPVVLQVGPGLISDGVAALVGPALERYAGAPWPAGSF